MNLRNRKDKKKSGMSRKLLVIAGVALIIICALWVGIKGRTYTLAYEVGDLGSSVSDYKITDDENGKVVRISDTWMDGGYLKIRLDSVNRGRTFISAFNKDGDGFADIVYVHMFGIITVGTFLGDCTGSGIIPKAVALYIFLIILYLIQRYRKNVRENMYRYRNVLQLGLIIFLCFIFWNQFHIMTVYRGLDNSIENTMNAANVFSTIMLPIAFVMSVLISISNIRLIMKEGRTWRNMLGLILGIMFMAGTIIPMFIGDWLQMNPYLDVHNEKGIGHFIEMAFNSSWYSVIAYLECVLIGTIIFGITSARHIPAFDKDYILILGCQIRKDGTVTPLLKSRVDRALEFGKMQESHSGKMIKYVPSGGQGPDEVMAEADAMKNYLVSEGVPLDRIISENKSLNTYQNIQNSMKLIHEDFDGDDPKVAFSTTNYHVFRSGMIAASQGYRLEGIGSRTKSYFWINAFVREYIATLVEERKLHLKICISLIAISLIMVLLHYISIVM